MTPRQLIEPARLAGNALLHTQSDARLVDLARAGNDRAFEVIVGRYRQPLLRYCERLLPPGRAEDAVQQAFLNAFRAIGRNEAELNLKPWLYRVAHNAALNLLRQNGWNYDEIPEDFDGVMQPPQALEQRERIRDVIRSVQELPERQRDAIILRELEGRSYEEIAGALGVTDGAVRQLLNRARGTLRAAATALTPPRLLESLVERASAPSATQIAELGAGAGGAVSVVKLGAALIVAGAVGGAVVTGPAHQLVLGGSGSRGRAQEALTVTGGGGGHSSLGGPTAFGIGVGPAAGSGEGPVGARQSRGGGSGKSGSTSNSGPGGGPGPGGGGPGPGGGGGTFADFNSGPGGGGGDHGGGGSGGDHGGSGGGSGDGGGGGSSSGSGDHSGGGDHGGSGGGSDGGSTGSGDTTSNFGSGLPTVGSSGPGDGGGSLSSGDGGSSGSGSGDGGSSGSGSGDSGSSGSSDGGASGPGG